MASVIEMREERARLFEEMKEIQDRADGEKRDLTSEEELKFTRCSDEIDRLGQEVSRKEREQRLELLRQKVESATPEWIKEEESDDEAQGLTDYIHGKAGKNYEVRYSAADMQNLGETRDLLAGSGTGANVVPISFVRRLREHLIENSAIRQTNATVLTTASGEAMRVPKTTAHPAPSAIVAEAGAILEADPTLAFVTLDAFKYANMAQLSSEFVQDEAVNVLEYLARANGVALANLSGSQFITGTGSAQPRGVVTAAASAFTASGTIAAFPTGDHLIDLYHSVVSGYRRNSYWLMSDATAARVRKIKDSTNQYLWQPGLQAGMPDALLGRPVVTDPTVPAVAASVKAILFGDFSGYYIRDVGSLRFERSDDFAFSTDLVSFRAIIRTDGDLVDENAVKAVTTPAT